MNKEKVQHQDHKYIVALRENNYELIEEIYSRCSNTISKMVISNKGNSEDAKDLFQETLISVFRQANEGYVLTCPIEQFMYIACKRKWINQLKKRRLDYGGDFNDVLKFKEDEGISPIDEIDQLIIDEDRASLVREKFKMLGPSCQEILKLSWSKDENGKYFNWKEIANQLDLSYAYVRKKASECKDRLGELVKKDPNYNRLKDG